MSYDSQNRVFIKKHYQALAELNIPTFILDDLKKWIFFLQEGWEPENNWSYSDNMSDHQQIQLYWLLDTNNIESCLSNNIKMKFELKDKSQFQIQKIKSEVNRTHFDFFINGKSLSVLLNIHRFDLRYCDFDLDIIDAENTENTTYNRKQINKQAVSSFLGKRNPINQLGTDRVVLYRCHCGSDYCGVISFSLQIDNDTVYWNDIRLETEDDEDYLLLMQEQKITPIKELQFDIREYEAQFDEYMKLYIKSKT